MHRRRQVPFLATLLGALLLASAAQAQVYRSSGPGGVSYSDQPPPPAAGRQVAPVGGGTPGTGGATLPSALSQTAQRYPVTLYSARDCAPCDSGRNLLVNRGVPFSEKTVQSNEDIEALQRLAGSGELPVLTVGGQRLKGYSDVEWGQYLDAAGYPKSSQLPAAYRRPAATPLVARSAVSAPAAAATAARQTPAAPTAPAEPSIAPPRTDTNPAGIRF